MHVEERLDLNYGTFELKYDPASGIWRLDYSAPGIAYNLGQGGTGYAGIFQFGRVPIEIYQNVDRGLRFLEEKFKSPEDWEKWKQSLRNGDQQSLLEWLATYIKQYEDVVKMSKALEKVIEVTKKKYGSKNQGIFKRLNETIQNLEAQYKVITANRERLRERIRKIMERLRDVIDKEKEVHPELYEYLKRYMKTEKGRAKTSQGGPTLGDKVKLTQGGYAIGGLIFYPVGYGTMSEEMKRELDEVMRMQKMRTMIREMMPSPREVIMKKEALPGWWSGRVERLPEKKKEKFPIEQAIKRPRPPALKMITEPVTVEGVEEAPERKVIMRRRVVRVPEKMLKRKILRIM